MDTFGSRLRSRRKIAQLTQRELGRLVGVSGPMVTQWENNQALPKKDNADRLCSVLNTTWSFLKDGIEVTASTPPAAGTAVAPEAHRPIPLLQKRQVVDYLAGTQVSVTIPSDMWGLPAMLGAGARCFAVVEDSTGMEPRIMRGETVIIDPDAPRAEGEWLYMANNGQPVIGVAKNTPRGMMLYFYSQEPGWEPIPVDTESAVGRVVLSIPVNNSDNQ